MLLPSDHLDGILNTFTEHMTVSAGSQFDQFVKEMALIWKMTPLNIHRLESCERWLVSLVSLLCSNAANHLVPETMENLLEIWAHGTSSTVRPKCKSAVTIIKKNLLMNPDDGVVGHLVKVFQRVASLMEEDLEALRLLVQQQLLPSAGEWKNLTNEVNAPHLMAKEYVSGNCFYNTLPTNVVAFKSIQGNSWSILIKTAFVISSVAVRNPPLFDGELLATIIPYLVYAAEVAELLLGLFTLRLKVAYFF